MMVPMREACTKVCGNSHIGATGGISVHYITPLIKEEKLIKEGAVNPGEGV
jgi:hypothetical protein